MKEDISEDIYKEIDEARILKALKDGNQKDALILFKYSSLSKEEFDKLLEKINSESQLDRTQLQSSDIWNQVLNIISSKVSSPTYEAWFEKTKGGFLGDSLIIFSKNHFQRDWLEVQYQDLISDIVKQITGKVYKINILTEQKW
ncbi:hypothetical protein CUC15_09620 [Oceanobacillus zhaokaii]|uniref:DnaA N-terminal domain-containing protein n=1 Tax=Oceanobacillus zhaokaii TaxID=2052660 RepID=A0A345PGN8_9BACI|nr:DnaA N-terminal domain-containing protein [Oceanobacillus zhaokaii]AXI09168.1 hypothetical protein CUC15_09620 [Oceanobacillus zhaokaii]